MKIDQKTKALITARVIKAPILMNTPLSGISTAANSRVAMSGVEV
jgi:hypothetical protein